MYEEYKICPMLSRKEKCFRVQQYEEGNVVEVFHEHVPANRISLDSEMEVLRTLVGQVAGWNGQFILHSRLNERRGGPSKYPSFISNVSYPEKGVLRRYIRSGGVTAWSDTVVTPGEFRRNSESKSGA
ncbi:MAG: hypothetical protein P8X48_02185 [Acidiferrobacteraceae bacterium]|jgi:hypothetical protein